MSGQERSRSRSRSRSRDARRRSHSPEDDFRSRRRSSSRDRRSNGDESRYGDGNGIYSNTRYDENRRGDRSRGEGGGFRHNNFNSSGPPPLPDSEGFQMNPNAAPFQPNPPININNFPGRQQRPQQQYQQQGGFQHNRQPFQKAPFRNTSGWSALPEDECCTLQITGIQQHVTESDLMTHFKGFGSVVKLQFSNSEEGSAPPNEYKECLVQFQSPADAKRCFNSPKAVLNNRFIKLLQAPYNILPIPEVEAYLAYNPYPEVHAHRGRKPSHKPHQIHEPSFGGPQAAHKFAHKQPTSWRQGDDEKPPAPAANVPTAADQAVLTQHSEIKRLREQKQALARKKEEVVRAQIQKFHDMLDKLQKSDSGKALVENLEGKIFELQRQLTELQHQQQLE